MHCRVFSSRHSRDPDTRDQRPANRDARNARRAREHPAMPDSPTTRTDNNPVPLNEEPRGPALMLLVLLASGVGCGGKTVEANPLTGVWIYTPAGEGPVRSIAVTFNSDGTAQERLTLGSPGIEASRACTGTPTLSGYSWAATPTSLTISGAPSSAGSISCPGTCGKASGCETWTYPLYALMSYARLNPNDPPQTYVTQVSGACDFVLSSDDQRLTLTNCTQTIELVQPSSGPRGFTDQLGAYTLTRAK
jgi:hypothetical protein